MYVASHSTMEHKCQNHCFTGRGDSDGDEPKSPPNGTEDGESCGKVLRTGKQYGCPHCSYSADKKVSLNRHMRMHSSSPASQIPVPLPVPVILPSALQNGTESPVTNPSQLVDRYCQDCDIRFYSVKTLKAHKMHYCSSRYAKGSPTGKNTSAPGSPTEPQRLSPEPTPQARLRRSAGEQPFLLLRTNPVLIVPYSLLQSASVFTGASPNFPSQDTPCILMPNGTLQPMSNLVPQLSNDKDLDKNSSYPGKHLTGSKVQEDSLPAKAVRCKMDSAPLDLSIRRSSENNDLVIDMEDEKENVFTSSPRREELRSPCQPSVFHGSVMSSDKRFDDRKQSECYSGTPSPNLSPSPNSKKSPRRTPNGLGGLRSDGGLKSGGKKGCDQEQQNPFLVTDHHTVRRNSTGSKVGVPLPGVAAQLPLLLPGTPSDLLSQVSLLPLLNADLRLPGLIGTQSISDSPVPQVKTTVS